MNGMITPTAQSDQIGRKVSEKGRKYFPRVLERAELKNLHHAGHKEDETKDEAGEENRPGAIQIWFHFSKLTRPRLVPEFSTPQKERVSTELYPQPALRLGAQRDSQHSTINSVKERGSHEALRAQLSQTAKPCKPKPNPPALQKLVAQ